MMNERIKELAIEARELATTRHPESGIVLFVNSEMFEEKFAEMLIEKFAYDCMDVTGMTEHIVFVAKQWGIEL